jgi:5'-deoxynucleotidase YfbR-like HD superfamily hydrolase
MKEKKMEKKILTSLDAYRNAFVTTYTGKRFKFFEATPDDIELEDIIHSLSNNCRYNGHCRRFFSVAEHSLLTADLVPEPYKLYALLHDAGEAYITDIPRPLKKLVDEYTDGLVYMMENHLMLQVDKKFDLGLHKNDSDHIVDLADNSAMWIETRTLYDPDTIKDWKLGETMDEEYISRFMIPEHAPLIEDIKDRFREELHKYIKEK